MSRAGAGIAIAWATVCLLGAPAMAETRSLEEVETCVRDNLPDDSSVQTLSLTTIDRVGNQTQTKAKIYWQKDEKGLSNLLLRFFEPSDMRGSALLLLERKGKNDMFMYLPELRRTRRVTSRMMSGSMFGTDFTYEEFQRLQGLAEDASSALKTDADVNGRKVWVVESKPDPESGSEYEQVVSHVDREMCVPIKVEFYEPGNRLRKVLEADLDRITREQDVWVPRSVTLKDLRDETSTTLDVEEIALHQEISRKTFSTAELDKGH